MQTTGDRRISHLVLVALLLVTAFGMVLRVHRLGSESIWLDEAYSIKFAHGSLSTIVSETASDVHPPLYYFALHYWINLFGDGEFSARLLSTLFGVLSIIAIYKVAALLFERATALMASLLLALSHFHVEFSQEARMYTLLTLLSLLSFYFFIRLLAERSKGILAGYIIASALMTYTHVYSFFILAAQGIFFLSLFFARREIFRRAFKRWLLAQFSLFVLFLPWLFVLLQQVSRVRKGFWIPVLPPRALYDTLIIYAGSTYLFWIFAPLALLALLQGLNGRRSSEEKNTSVPAQDDRSGLTPSLKTYLLLLWLLCPVVVPFIISQFTSPIFLPKYTIAASLAFIILIARGLIAVRFHQLRLLLILLVAAFALIYLKNYYGSIRKDLWRDAAADFEKLARPNDLLLFNEPSGQVPFDYYLRRTDLVEKPFPDYSAELRPDNVAELLRPAIANHDRVWLVLSHQSALTPLIAEQLTAWDNLTAHLIEPGIELYLFEKRE